MVVLPAPSSPGSGDRAGPTSKPRPSTAVTGPYRLVRWSTFSMWAVLPGWSGARGLVPHQGRPDSGPAGIREVASRFAGRIAGRRASGGPGQKPRHRLPCALWRARGLSRKGSCGCSAGIPECAAIDRLLDDARAGAGLALVVRGEPGIGKSALVDYARQRAAPMAVLPAAGVEAESDLAFAGLHGLLRPVLAHLRELPQPQSAALAGALGLAPSTQSDRLLICAAVLGLLAAAAEDRPVLCVVDDGAVDGSAVGRCAGVYCPPAAGRAAGDVVRSARG